MKHLKYFMMSLMALLILGAGSAFAAAADKDEVDFGALELNKTYNMKDSYYYYGTFTPAEDGYLHVYSTGTNSIRAFKEWLGTAKATMASSENTFVLLQLRLKDNFNYNYELPVKKGVTYYMCGNTMKGDDINVTLKMEPKTIEYLGASVSEGEEVSPTGSSSVSFSFNRPVVAKSAAVVYGDGEEMSLSPRSSSYACSVSTDVKDAFIKLANTGKIKTGDKVTIVLRDIKEDADDVQEGDEPVVYGDVSIQVTVGDMPAMLQSATMDGVPVNANTKFMTYYAPGTGILKLTYSKELGDNSSAYAQLTFGDFDEADNGGYYKERSGTDGNFTMKVEGNQVILDFSGKRRTVSDMVTSTESNRGVDFTVINLMVANLEDANGVRVNSNGSTTTGRYNATFSLDIPTANVASEFTPANGASIKNVDNIEIWIQDEQSLSYLGVSFSYNKPENGIEVKADGDELVDAVEEIVVSKDQIKREYIEEEDAVVLTVPVSADVKDKKNVTVALYKVTCVDGKDYSKIVAAEYNPADVTGIANITFDANKAVKVYNLNGQLVSEGTSFKGLKGVYIVNGKKMVLK